MKLLAYFATLTACVAQNFAVISHKNADTEEFKLGCPGDWPAGIFPLGTNTALPDSLKAPWVVMTAEELKSLKASLESAKEEWNNRTLPVPLEVTERRQLISDITRDLRQIAVSSGTLSAAQLSTAVRRLSQTILLLLDEQRVTLEK